MLINLVRNRTRVETPTNVTSTKQFVFARVRFLCSLVFASFVLLRFGFRLLFFGLFIGNFHLYVYVLKYLGLWAPRYHDLNDFGRGAANEYTLETHPLSTLMTYGW